MLGAYALAAVLGYALGSFPTGYLVGRAHGIDIREHGSRNIGATNVVRVLGKRPGFLVFFGDALKGWLAVVAGYYLAHHFVSPRVYSMVADYVRDQPLDAFAAANAISAQISHGSFLAVTAATACLLGHNFPVWLRFRGGKGIATSAGVLLGLMPLAVLVSGALWALAFYTLRYVSVASILAAATLPVTVATLWRTGRADGALFAFSLLAAALAIWRHRSNIQRLLAGTEPRFQRKAEGGRRKAE